MRGSGGQQEPGIRGSAVPATLRGWPLLIVRATWLALAAICLGIFVAAILVRLAQPGEFFMDGVSTLSITIALGFTARSYATFSTACDVLTATAYCVVAALIFRRKSAERGPLLIAMVLVLAGTAGTETFTVAAPLPAPLARLNWGLIAAAALLFMGFLFPDGRFVPRWAPLAWPAWLATPAAWMWMGASSPLDGTAIAGWDWFTYILVLIGLPVYAQVHRYRRVSAPREREQAKWATLGFGGARLILAGLTIAGGLIKPWEGIDPRYFLINTLMVRLATLLIPLAIGVAILRSRLYDIDVLINRALVYTTLTALLGLAYAGGVASLQLAIGGRIGGSAQLPIVASTLGTFALAQPLRRRIQFVIDRRFYRRKYDAARVVAAFGITLQQETDLDRLRASLLATVGETMQPDSVSLWLRAAASAVQLRPLPPAALRRNVSVTPER